MRLNRYLAACGLGSRRRCEELIRSGRVRVNGEPPPLGHRVTDTDQVTLDGRPLVPQRTGGVWMLHKPAGVVCTARDPQGRPTVVDLARQQGIVSRLFPVGRLDLETTGLLLLTDDGDLAFRLTHPSWGVEKEYEAQVSRELLAEELQQLQQGVDLDDGRTLPCRAEPVRRGRHFVLRLILMEGRKRQIRRMLQALGIPLQHLHRVRVGPLELGDLPAGGLRPCSTEQIEALQSALSAGKRQPAPRPGIQSSKGTAGPPGTPGTRGNERA